jgi:acetoin utilization deacetylase AcuC-like enzyme
VLLVADNAASDLHDTGRRHPERPARLPAALAGIDEAGLGDAVVPLAPRRATDEELQRVHDARALDAVRTLCERGGGNIDADTVVAAGSWDTALLAAGATLAAVDALEAGRGDVAFVAVRPPGHHATRTRPMGFCLMNNIAVAAAALAERRERVLVLDWDVHHGNGTQDIFWDDPRVLYVSTHQWPLYPGTGGVQETGGPGAPGLTVNIPLPAGTAGDPVRRALDEVVAPVVERFAPTWVLVSAGFDAHRDDPLAELRLTAGDFADLARRVRGYCPGPGRLAFVLEGGYDLDALRHSVGASLAAVLDGDYRPEPASSGSADPRAAAAVDGAADVHGLVARDATP